MLQTCGIASKVSLNMNERLSNLPDGRGGMANYKSKNLWRILVGSNDLQKLFETDAGLKTTRNYEGCNHVEGFFNEESSKYVVIQHWDSFEEYNAYADWRFNEDPSGLVGKMLPLISGGADGISIYSNNTGYGFY